MLFCLANPFAQRHPLSARVLTEKFSFPHSSFFPCSLALLSPFGCECTAAFILTDSDLARGHWHYCLPTCWDLDVYPSAVTRYSVHLNSHWLYYNMFVIWVSPPYLHFLPLHLLLFAPLCLSPLPNFALQTLWKHPFKEAATWQLAVLIRWCKHTGTWTLLEQEPSLILPAKCLPQGGHIRLLLKTQMWRDHKDQCIKLYVTTSNNMANFKAEQPLITKDAQLTIRLLCFSTPLTPYFPSFPTGFLC